MTDNLEKIKHLLTFKSTDDFYYLQLLQRKKDNPHLKSNGRIIKDYYIKNLEQLEELYDEIKKLCNMFNARASLRLNKRSFRKVTFVNLAILADLIEKENDYMFSRKAFSKACGRTHSDKNKKWIIDIDWDDIDKDHDEFINDMKITLNRIRPEGEKVIVELPTKNGIHIITSPFDVHSFRSEGYSEIDIHKDNPINLYIP
jgi:hypothetical protein